MTTPTFTLVYPRPMDVTFFCTWLRDGDSVFRIDSPVRDRGLMALRELIRTLDLPASCEAMRHEILGGGASGTPGERYGMAPRPELQNSLFAALRLNGYLFPVSLTGSDCWVRTPLTAKQLHILRLLIMGNTLEQCAPVIGIKPANVRERLRTARNQLGVATTYQLIAHAYRSGWFPDAAELAALHEPGDWQSSGYAVIEQ